MPVVRVEMLSGRNRDQKQELAMALTRETSRIAGCAEADVQVIFTEVERQDWAVGGVLNDVKMSVKS